MWSVTPTTNWIIVFGGEKSLIGTIGTQVIELSKYMYAVVRGVAGKLGMVGLFKCAERAKKF